jgi:hypothetical protein
MRTTWQNTPQANLSVTRRKATDVYGVDQQKIGNIERVMIDKMSGKVAYAVFGLSRLPWHRHDHYDWRWSRENDQRQVAPY